MYYSHEGAATGPYRAIIRLPSFERSAKGLLSEVEHDWLDQVLGANPEAGPIMRGTGGVRKLRLALPGRGKSGGARVIYYYRGARERVFLILVYPKNARENLTAGERHRMCQLAAMLETEP